MRNVLSDAPQEGRRRPSVAGWITEFLFECNSLSEIRYASAVGTLARTVTGAIYGLPTVEFIYSLTGGGI